MIFNKPMSSIETRSKKYKIICCILLAIMIIVQLGIITYYMAERKVGYHMDELWSYGLSNSYYHPHLYARDGVEEWGTYNEWHDDDLFKNYLTVGDEERFEYGSVYYNQKHDVHPPLYYFVLHTICSFFPNSFSRWYGFAINAVSFVVSQILLYLCVRKISKSEILALAVCAMWGFSTGAITCHIYLRMYAMLIAFTLAYTYLNLKMLYDGFSAKRLAALCVITYLGSLTQYFFIIYAGVMAACLCIYYLIKKKYKQFFAYGGFLLLSVGLAVLSFIPMLSHLFIRNDYFGIHASRSKHKTFALQIHFILRYMLDEISGIPINLIDRPTEAYVVCALAVMAVIGIPLCFLFRNETWFKAFLVKVKAVAVSTVKFVRSKIGFSVAVLLILAISACSVFVVNGLVSPIAMMKERSSHYSVQVYPIVILVVLCFVYMFLRSMPKHSKICTPVALTACVGCIFGSRFGCEVEYLYEEGLENSTIATKVGDISETCSVIVISSGGSSVHIYPDDLYNADSLFLTSYITYQDYAEELDKAGADGAEIYLVLESEGLIGTVYEQEKLDVLDHQRDPNAEVENIEETLEMMNNISADNRVLDYFKENTRFENIEYIGVRYIYDYEHLVYKLS